MAKRLSKDLQASVIATTEAFNKKHKTNFHFTFRGQFAYLAKTEKRDMGETNILKGLMAQFLGAAAANDMVQDSPTIETKLGRLKYNEEKDNWSFAVFRYSREIYDADEFFFPGAEELDGTIEGALRAGMQVYP